MPRNPGYNKFEPTAPRGDIWGYTWMHGYSPPASGATRIAPLVDYPPGLFVEEEQLELDYQALPLQYEELGLEVDTLPLPSIGSAKHGSAGNRCKPCVFVHTKGCANGINCPFCHLCEPGEKQRRQKERQLNMRRRIAAKGVASERRRPKWNDEPMQERPSGTQGQQAVVPWTLGMKAATDADLNMKANAYAYEDLKMKAAADADLNMKAAAYAYEYAL